MHHAIAAFTAELVEDGATLQLGIGAIHNAVAAALRDRSDLGIHSEVISDGLVDLISRGVVNGSRKTINRGKVVVAFLNGSRKLYEFADDNPMGEMRQVDDTNDTRVILRLDNMVAVNSAIQMDLTGRPAGSPWGDACTAGWADSWTFFAELRYREADSRSSPCRPQRARAASRASCQPWTRAQRSPPRASTSTGGHRARPRESAWPGHRPARALIGIAAPAFRDQLAGSAHRLGLLGRDRT